MELSALAGNLRLKRLLSQGEEGRGLSHAYLISGPAGSGRHTLARLLGAAMVCTAPPAQRPCGRCSGCRKALGERHPDVKLLGEEEKPLSVDQVRLLRADAYVRPNEGERKVYILARADEMNPSAQNALLKLLEEGPVYAAFLLLCENPGGVLQTVRSRCEELPLAPVSPGECLAWLRGRFPQVGEEELRRAAEGCQGILGRAVELLKGPDGPWRAREDLARRLAAAVESGSELELLEQALVLEKAGREEVVPTLEALERVLGERARAGGDVRRLLRGTELVAQLRQAARLNVGGGQLAGWLCAGMFSQDGQEADPASQAMNRG